MKRTCLIITKLLCDICCCLFEISIINIKIANNVQISPRTTKIFSRTTGWRPLHWRTVVNTVVNIPTRLKAGKPQVTVEYWAFLPSIRKVHGSYRGPESCNSDCESTCGFLQDHRSVFTLYAYSKWDRVSHILCGSLFTNHCYTLVCAIDSIVKYFVNQWTGKGIRNTITLITQRTVIKQALRIHKCTEGFGEETTGRGHLEDIGSFILQSVLRQVRSLFQSEFSI
jgi:hypothetical protein